MATPLPTTRVADGVHVFAGTEVNWVLVQEGTDLTLVDAGWVGDTQLVERSIRSIGRRPEDLRAVLLTHAHADHTGAIEHLHRSYGVPVFLAAAELPNARGVRVESGRPADVARQLYRPRVARWAVEIVRAGGLQPRTTPAATAFPREGALDLPGRPVPVATPGHTSGHTSYLLPTAGAVVTGDALISAHPTVNGVGPQLLPAAYSHDQRAVVASLEALRPLDADAFVPGHGPTWFGSIDAAVDQALDRALDRTRTRTLTGVRMRTSLLRTAAER